MIDAIKGKWIPNGVGIIILIFIVGIAMECQSYMSAVDASKKHTDSYEVRREHYDNVIATQGVFNAKIEKDFYHLSKTYQKDISNINKKLDSVIDELNRLKLVEIEFKGSKNAKEKSKQG